VGYDFIFGGSVLRGRETLLLSELARFGRSIDLDVIPVHFELTGTIERFDMMDGDTPKEFDSPIQRDWNVIEYPVDIILHQKVAVQREIVQGIGLLHHYECWLIAWNLSHGGRLANYHPKQTSGNLGNDLQEIFPLVGKQDQVAIPSAVPVSIMWEMCCTLGVPWRRSDVQLAVDLLRIVQRHCRDDFFVFDDYGVWAEGIHRWRNLAGTYAEQLGGTTAHPDPAELLREDPDEPGE
jgi:hypothetical protein